MLALVSFIITLDFSRLTMGQSMVIMETSLFLVLQVDVAAPSTGVRGVRSRQNKVNISQKIASDLCNIRSVSRFSGPVLLGPVLFLRPCVSPVRRR